MKNALKKTQLTARKEKKAKNIIEQNATRHFVLDQEILKKIKQRDNRIITELDTGFRVVGLYPKSVTFFGSARTKPSDPYYQFARELAGELCQAGYAIITGGGPGIMEAGNRGTYESCGYGIGFNIELPFEQIINPYVSHGVNFHYFFTRKVSLSFSGEAYIYFPGGFGTMDEFFEIITLIQTKKMPKVPIILVGKKYWSPLIKVFEKTFLKEFKTISKGDLKLFKLVEANEAGKKEILKIVKKAKLRNEYK